MTNKQIVETESKYNVKILYVTRSGSHLYGTNTATSDEDFKGIYLPSTNARLLGTAPDYINLDTNKSNTANTPDDVDCHLDSIHKFFHLLAKGETGAIDTLFSMWSDSVVYSNTDFHNFCKTNYLSLITSNPHAFIGYAIGQSKMYNIRGERYNELVKFTSHLSMELGSSTSSATLGTIPMDLDEYEHIKYVQLDSPRGTTGMWTYLQVLGKNFAPTVKLGYLEDKLVDMQSQYGARAKKAVNNIDWKSLSHALRVVLEVQELLSTSFIKFPLLQRSYLLDIKQGKVDLDVVVNTLEHIIQEVDKLLLTTTLNKEADRYLSNNYILSLYKEQPGKSIRSEAKEFLSVHVV